ncbi:hypothetical protein EMGBS15_04840 [Filimonas sp.]|nr:hypothetical protein EMGBS15_04840 [Filimonas sp.]
MINKQHYEEYLIDYLHGELHGELKREMEEMIETDKEVKAEYALLKQTLLETDETIIFEHKHLLYKKSEATFFVRYKRVFAAAALIAGIIISLFLLMQRSHTLLPEENAYTDQPVQKPAMTQAPIMQPDDTPIAPKAAVSKTGSPVRFNNNPVQPKANIIKPSPSPQPIKVEEVIVKQDQIPIHKTDLQPIEHPLPVMIEPAIQEVVAKADVPASNPEISEAPDTDGKNTWTFSERKQPRLFRALAQLSRLSRKVKHTKDQLTKTEITVMLGNKKIINLN